jgi:hypothetical protein
MGGEKMKKKVGDRVYLQKYDVGFITHELSSVPACIMDQVFEKNSVFVSNGFEDAVKFSHAFTGEAADWIMAQDWLVNFDDYANMTEAQIREIWNREHEKFEKDVNAFNSRDAEYKESHFAKVSEGFDKRGHRLRSLSLIRLYKSGEKYFEVPGVKKKHHFFKS